MAASIVSARISLSSTAHRHLLLKTPPLLPKKPIHLPTTQCHFHLPSFPLHHPPPFKFPVSNSPHFSTPSNPFFFFNLDQNPSHWSFASYPTNSSHDNILPAATDGKDPEAAVVLLGWLGAKRKHLRKYVEWYNGKGVHAVTFVASVTDVLSFDLGKKVEERVKRLSDELAAWLAESRNRFLVFHTFSNTGWLAYGAILDNLRGREDLMERIKGCVVDSGGDPNIDPKVWAAGFTAALLKKSSSATYAASTETGQSSTTEEKEPILIETFLLGAFEKLFSYLLNLPDVNGKLTKIISTLSNDQPSCPQLYLYSTGDKVIPFEAVESFIEDQRKLGKLVCTFNFHSSPHVDHYRTFPAVYAFQLNNFLKECFAPSTETIET